MRGTLVKRFMPASSLLTLFSRRMILRWGRLWMQFHTASSGRTPRYSLWKTMCRADPIIVDCHRTVALAISPYTRRGHVDSIMYSVAGMLRTVEMILGLPPMSQYDASATPMWASF